MTIKLVQLIRMTCPLETVDRKVILEEMNVAKVSGFIMRKAPTSEYACDATCIDDALAYGKNAISISIPTVSAPGGV